MDDDIDDKDDPKRKSRNLSEKKRRDQFNVLVNELANMVCPNTRKMDKSTVLKSTILFLKNHNETTVRSRVHEIQEDWKPSFLSNEEFTHLILEAVDGFIMVFSSNGRIYYVSESVVSLLGYSPNELENTTIYNITYHEDQSHLYNVFLNPANLTDKRNLKKEERVSFSCHIKRGGFDYQEDPIYERVQFVGYFRCDGEVDGDTILFSKKSTSTSGLDNKIIFVGTGRLQTPQLIRELSVMDSTKPEFTSRHSLEWKFLFLDHRAPPIIGYMPFEVLGTSGYDYYHVDDLDNVVTCHESLMQKGEGTSCYYRFLTKGQQWIWLQTRFYITYNQWNSKPEFIVCTHYVVSYMEVMKDLRKDLDVESTLPPNADVLLPVNQQQQESQISTSPCQMPLTQWPTKTGKASKAIAASSTRPQYHGDGSDSSSMSASMQSSPHSRITHASKSKALSVTGSKTRPHIDTSQQPQPQQQPHQQHSLNVDTSCMNFVQPTQYATVNLQPVVAAGFANPNAPILSTLPTHEMMHQQGIVMTPAQNQIQDELERKHEELQQSIVHQQEELRRVSEQLLIAKYGLLSPLLNAAIPYSTTNICQQMSRCNTNTSNMQLSASSSVQGTNVLPIPITVPVPIVSTELFSHSLPLSPIPTGPGTSQGNASVLMQSQPPPHLVQAEQRGSTDQESSAADLVPFQMCPQQTDMLYSDIEPQPNQQQGPSQN